MVMRKIKMNELTTIYVFAERARAVDGDVILHKGHFSVDGKSLLGIMSIDMTDGVVVEYPTDAIDFENFVKEFEV